MVFLVTEELQEYLELESRDISLPNGSIRSLTNFKDIWNSLDQLAKYCSFSEEELIEFTVLNANERKISFEKSFTESIGYFHQKLKYICDRKISERIAHIENVLKSLEDKASHAFNQMS